MMDQWRITKNAVPKSPEAGWFIKKVAWTRKEVDTASVWYGG
jgi:hypothetical protein